MKNTQKATATRSQKSTPTTRKVALAAVRPTDSKTAEQVAKTIATARRSSGRTREAMRIAILAAIARCLATGKPVRITWQETTDDGDTITRSFCEATYTAGSYYGAHRPVNNLLTDDQRGRVRVACVTGAPDKRRFTAERDVIGDVYIVPAAMPTRKTDPVPAGM